MKGEISMGSNIIRSLGVTCDKNDLLMVGWVWTAGSDGPGFKHRGEECFRMKFKYQRLGGENMEDPEEI